MAELDLKSLFSARAEESRANGGNAFGTVLFILLGSAAVTLIIRVLYYFAYPWIGAQNLIYPAGTITPWVVDWTVERDGIELYALYVTMFIILGVSLTVAALVNRFATSRVLGGLVALAGVLAYVQAISVTFTSPVDSVILSLGIRVLCTLLFGVLLLFVVHIQEKIPPAAEAIIAGIAFIPFCFITTSQIALSNYAYIFDPAQQLARGIDVTQIYFQYEFFLSFLAAIWMKLGWNLTEFQTLGQISNFAAMFGLYLMSRSIFRRRALSLLLLFAYVVVRIASAPWDPVYVFQAVPLRLDMWIVLFAIVFWKGPYHWLIPFTCGVLMVVHGAFGQAYTLAYIQLILTLQIISLIESGWRIKLAEWTSASNIVRALIILAYLAASYFLANALFGRSAEAARYYQTIGIGFIPVSQSSFYWLVPILLASVFTMLLYFRGVFSKRYIYLGYAVVYFSIANSIYFFGRSHEMNLFALSISLLFLLFFAFDVVDRAINHLAGERLKPWANGLSVTMAVVFLLTAAYVCADRIVSNMSLKAHNALAGQIHQGDPVRDWEAWVAPILDEIDSHIGSSAPIQFLILDQNREFALYQLRSTNRAFFYPFASWVFVDEVVEHAQEMLEEGYYLLIDRRYVDGVFDRLTDVRYRVTMTSGDYLLLGKKPPDPATD